MLCFQKQNIILYTIYDLVKQVNNFFRTAQAFSLGYILWGWFVRFSNVFLHITLMFWEPVSLPCTMYMVLSHRKGVVRSQTLIQFSWHMLSLCKRERFQGHLTSIYHGQRSGGIRESIRTKWCMPELLNDQLQWWFKPWTLFSEMDQL